MGIRGMKVPVIYRVLGKRIEIVLKHKVIDIDKKHRMKYVAGARERQEQCRRSEMTPVLVIGFLKECHEKAVRYHDYIDYGV